MQRTEVQGDIGVDRQRHFIRAMCKSIDGRYVTKSEGALLDEILVALLRGDDVSDLIGIRPAHTRRSADPIYVALHYLCLTKLMHVSSVDAWRTVGAAWGLKKHSVQWLIADNRAPALALLKQFTGTPDTLIRLCEANARGNRPDRRQSMSGSRTHGTGDTRGAT
jgi:hypothetical protein